MAFTELTSSGFEWDLIYLGVGIWLGDNEPSTECANSSSDSASCLSSPFFARLGFSYGTSGYVISARGAKRLLATNYRNCLFAVDE